MLNVAYGSNMPIVLPDILLFNFLSDLSLSHNIDDEPQSPPHSDP